ncbi:bifunctional serine/threonine-protein kinase/ABC transporter substrate-binding protein [Streptomyces sp. CA-249302]|uniref:bifunctional serine/threonine-protein kinase/ABC transporter substrate-binding protein n=1 Tax=Streptomyces sp. CA-249302 TaxID=3240058 RepID=UPI003D93767C
MLALRAEDPEELGGHRLLARLGSGGMGVVYLARAADGALVALKVIRAEYAADPAFRARFRREVRLATGLSGPWLVPVTAADAEAREPWLAGTFVPGPSLTEAVETYGPLPAPTVVVLGRLLAQALAEVHEAGLVHRDVKPANVLLAVDGPRLIDFGIAQGAGATALTSPDAVVGTPGYLSPEQARADEVGAPSDVFSLGCALAYAATGRRPFGTGDPAAVLYRTVHESPDLAGLERLLPPPVHTAITGCLAKAPGDRPTSAALHRVLVAAAESAGSSVAAAGLTAVSDADGSSGPMGPPGTAAPAVPLDWLPSTVLRLVADRSARALDPPPRAAAASPRAGAQGDGVRSPSRRRLLTVAGSAAAVLAASGVGAAVVLTRKSAASGGSTHGVPTHVIGLQADLTGPQKSLGTEHERGVRLAVAAHNARTDVRFRLAVKTVDDGGEAARARRAARTLIADPAVLAVVGPTGTLTVRAVGRLYDTASTPLVVVSVEPTATGLLTNADLRTICVTRVPQRAEDYPLLDYLTRVHRTHRTSVIVDRASGDPVWALAQALDETPPAHGTAALHEVPADQDDFGPAVAAALDFRAQAVVCMSTSPARAARCAQALATADFTGPRLGLEAVMRPAFLTAAGAAAEGWVLEAPYTDPASDGSKAARAFTAAYRERYGSAPGPWSAEAYDAVGLIAATLTALGGGTGTERGQVAERIFRTTYDGVAKRLDFDEDTRALESMGKTFLYQVTDGEFRFLGRNDRVGA